MSLYIFKTNIKSRRKARMFGAIFRKNPRIFSWSIDFEDKDKVLRMEADQEVKDQEIIQLVANHGFLCEVLPD